MSGPGRFGASGASSLKGGTLTRNIRVERVGQENAGAEQGEEGRDCFDHRLAPPVATPARELLRDQSYIRLIMKSHMTDPLGLIGLFDNGSLFQDVFVRLENGFVRCLDRSGRPATNVATR
jgi:hypothetical protein